MQTELQELSKHGFVFYLPVEGLKDKVWLNPEKLIQEIQTSIIQKAIQHSEKSKEKKGVIKINDLNDLLRNDLLQNEQELQAKLILLLNQKIIFKDEGQGNYIFPNYLPLKNENDSHYQLMNLWLDKPHCTLYFRDFIPSGIINQVICFFGQQPDTKEYWRDRILFTLNETQQKILISFDFTKLTVQIHIQNKNNQSIEVVLKYIFYCILGFYWGMKLLNYEDFFQNLRQSHNLEDENNKAHNSKQDQFYSEEIHFLNSLYNISDSNEKYIISDLYISRDGKNFASYREVMKLVETSLNIQSYRINFEDDITEQEKIITSKITTSKTFEFATMIKFKGPKKVFISYSSEDYSYKEEMKKYLINLERDGAIQIWDDSQIETGTKWNQEIIEQVESSDIFILLLTQDFLNSSYIRIEEVGKALKKLKDNNAAIFPIYLKQCTYQNWRMSNIDTEKKDKSERNNDEETEDLFMGNFQLFPKINGKLKAIVTDMDDRREAAWVLIEKELMKVIKKT